MQDYQAKVKKLENQLKKANEKLKEFEEKEYQKLATTFYVKNPRQIAFETK